MRRKSRKCKRHAERRIESVGGRAKVRLVTTRHDCPTELPYLSGHRESPTLTTDNLPEELPIEIFDLYY